IEGQGVKYVDAETSDQPRLDAERRQAERDRRGTEELLRMRLEGEHAERRSPFLRHAARGADQRLMAQMHAVEISDRHHRALKGIGDVAIVAENLHGPIAASPSITVTSPTLQTQSKVTRRLASTTSRTVQVAVTVSPMRTGPLKRVVSDMKIVPGPGICMPSTVEM